MMTTVCPAYPSIRTPADAIQHARALAWHHMHAMDTDESLATAYAWAAARSGIAQRRYKAAYRQHAISMGWDGVPGSMVGVSTLLDAAAIARATGAAT